MKKTLTLVLALALAPSLAAAKSPTQILKKVDTAVNPFKDRVFEVKMTMKGADGSKKVVQMKMAERGYGKQRLMIFTKPGDVKGMGILTTGRRSIYVYLPAFHRVRKVAMHARRQSFQGSDFTFDDMAQIRFAPDYKPKILSKKGKYMVMELTPKDAGELAYKKLIIHIDKKTLLVDKIEYFDGNGHWKTETRGGGKVVEGSKIYTDIKMVDHRTKHTTRIKVLDLEANPGLSRRLFTKRGLIRGKI